MVQEPEQFDPMTGPMVAEDDGIPAQDLRVGQIWKSSKTGQRLYIESIAGVSRPIHLHFFDGPRDGDADIGQIRDTPHRWEAWEVEEWIDHEGAVMVEVYRG